MGNTNKVTIMGIVQRVNTTSTPQTSTVTTTSSQPYLNEVSERPVSYAKRKKRYSDKGWVTEQSGSYVPYEVKKTSEGYEVIERGTYTSYSAGRTQDERVYVKKRLLLDKDGYVVREEKYSLSKEGDKQSPKLDRLVDYKQGVYDNPRLSRSQKSYSVTKKAEAVLRAKRAGGFVSPTGVAKEEARVKMLNRVNKGQWRKANLKSALEFDKQHGRPGVQESTSVVLVPDMSDIINRPKGVSVKPVSGKYVPEPYKYDEISAGKPGIKEKALTRAGFVVSGVKSDVKKYGGRFSAAYDSPVTQAFFPARLKQSDYAKGRAYLLKGASYADTKAGRGRAITRIDLRTRTKTSFTPGAGLPLKNVVEFALPGTVYQLGAEIATGWGAERVLVKGGSLAFKGVKSLGGKLPKVKFNVVSNQADDFLIRIPGLDKRGVVRGSKRGRQIRISKVARRKATYNQAYNPNVRTKEFVIKTKGQGRAKIELTETQASNIKGLNIQRTSKIKVPQEQKISLKTIKSKPQNMVFFSPGTESKPGNLYVLSKTRGAKAQKAYFINDKRVGVGDVPKTDLTSKRLFHQHKLQVADTWAGQSLPKQYTRAERRAFRKRSKGVLRGSDVKKNIPDNIQSAFMANWNTQLANYKLTHTPKLTFVDITAKRVPKKQLVSLNINRPKTALSFEEKFRLDFRNKLLEYEKEEALKLQKISSRGGFRKGQKEKLISKARAKQRATYFKQLPSYHNLPEYRLDNDINLGKGMFDSLTDTFSGKTKKIKLFDNDVEYVNLPSWDWADKSAAQNIFGRSITSKPSVSTRLNDVTKLGLGTSNANKILPKYALGSVLGTGLALGQSSASLQKQAQIQSQKQAQISKQMLGSTTKYRTSTLQTPKKVIKQYKTTKQIKINRPKPPKLPRPKIKTPTIKVPKTPKPPKIRDYTYKPGGGRFRFKFPDGKEEKKKRTNRGTTGFERFYDFGGFKL